MAEIRRFMLVFGLLSSLFDLLAFYVLVAVFDANAMQFQTAWFVISLLTELAVLLVLRTAGPCWRSVPAPLLLVTSVAVVAVALVLPYSGRLATLFGFVALPFTVLAFCLAVVATYVVITEISKRYYYRRGASLSPQVGRFG